MKPVRNMFLFSLAFMMLLAGCSTGGQSGQSGQSNSKSSPLRSTGYKPPNHAKDGNDATNEKAGDDSKDSKSDSAGDKQKVDSIGFLEPAGVAKDSKIIDRVANDLSYVAFFSYRIKSDGSLISLKDQTALKAVKQSKAKPMLVITNFANGTFSSDIGHAILTDKKAADSLINNVIKVMKTKKYAALNIDFEHLKEEDRDRYTAFLKKLTPKVKKAGFPVSTALAPKKSGKQTGSWYSAHDYGAHAKIVDFVILMTYEWGWSGGPPMAVAPINQVKSVLDYATSVIPHDKIIMGMPLYGYDWTLPYKKGGPNAKRLGLQEAPALAKKQGVEVNYDQKSQSPFFHYKDQDGRKHVVWFENGKSLQAKFDLVKKYKLRGASYWELGEPAQKNWELLKKNFKINTK